MKNFYRRLNISPSSSYVEIKRAVSASSTDPALVEAASYVLLEAHRRPVYDRCHRTLSTVGQLRANLGLSATPGWAASNAADYNVEPSQESELDRLRQAAGTQKKNGSTKATLFRLAAPYVLLGILFLGAVVWGSLTDDDSGSASDNEASSRNTGQPFSSDDFLEPQKPTVPALPLPRNGDVTRYSYGQRALAPFTVRTRSGSGNYYVKLVNVRTNNTVMTLFVREGRTAETKVPLGTYEVRYAVGDKWYGREHLFGPHTSYARCDESFRFYRTSTGYQGYTVELYLQQFGNLETEDISRDEF